MLGVRDRRCKSWPIDEERCFLCPQAETLSFRQRPLLEDCFPSSSKQYKEIDHGGTLIKVPCHAHKNPQATNAVVHSNHQWPPCNVALWSEVIKMARSSRLIEPSLPPKGLFDCCRCRSSGSKRSFPDRSTITQILMGILTSNCRQAMCHAGQR